MPLLIMGITMIINILLGLILADLLVISFMVFVIGKIIDEKLK
tara:strand:+ start:1041 stop:1169 length:129 start_codon:yes stop_codon:yes gene_type:complete